jgi:uncharacterized repeat protein (TIGR03803 family)
MSKLVWRRYFWSACALCLATATTVLAQVRFTTLADFNGTNGNGVLGSLVQGLDGNFYGTASGGGANGGGTLFEITPNGILTALYNFCSQSGCTDGEYPQAGLTLGTDGNFYGTAAQGGASLHYGTVFRAAPSGAVTTLYNFCSEANCADGANPLAPLALGADGSFYGTTYVGGTFINCGTVFSVTPRGTLATLYSFNCQPDGANPSAGLAQDINGDFYGTTQYSGGTVFSITQAGVFTAVFNFTGGPSGNQPLGLVASSNGNLYGTTSNGGDFGCGTVFEMTPWGSLTTLYMFTGASDGCNPSQLVEGSDGNLYGTAQEGGYFNNQCSEGGCGTVFKVTPQGRLTTLHKFCAQLDCTDGDYPRAGLIQATDGTFYGSTIAGGSDGNGTVFRLSVGLAPFIETLPTSGKAGSTVRILGTNLTGVTSVTFNDTAATFTVESSSCIETTVPAGATTGTVQVVTPSGTLSSNVSFRVTP